MPVRRQTPARTALLRTCALGSAVLLLSSCGLRVDDDLRATGIRGATAGGTSTLTGEGGVNPDGTVDPGQGGDLAGGTGGTGGAGTGGTGNGGTGGSGSGTGGTGIGGTGGSGSGGSTGTGGTGGTGSSGGTGTAPGAAAPPGGNGGATDVGVTADSITLGNVSTLSGPVPGLFSGAVFGTRAYLAYQNSLGGVFGRQLKLAVADDQLDCGQNRAQHLTQLPKVFGFAGSLSLYDNCGAEVLEKNKTVSEVAIAFSTKAGNLQNNFSIAPLVPGYRLGSLQYYKSKFPDAIGSTASLVGNIGSAVEIWQGIKAAAESIGYKVEYERNYSPGETDFTADIIQMRQKGIKMLYFVSADSHTISRVLNTARQQNWSPQVIAVGAGNAIYDPGFIAEAGAAANNVFADQGHAMYFNKEDGANIPGVARYQEWMNKIGQGKRTDLYSAWGWASAQLAVEGLKKAGPKLTREGWLNALKSIKRFDGDGMFAPSDPSGKKPATCYLVMKIVEGKFVRTDTPTKSFRCDAGYFFFKR